MDNKSKQILEFANYLKFTRRASSHTIRAYTDDVSHFLSFAEGKPLNRDIVRAWLIEFAEKGYDARSINRKLYSVKCFTRYCRKIGTLDEDPVKRISQRKIKSRIPRYFSEAEMQEAIKFKHPERSHGLTRQRDQIILRLLYETGMRRGELISMKKQDIDFSQEILKVTGKGGNERLIPLSPLMTKVLKFYSEKTTSEYLFCQRGGNKLDPRTIHDAVNRQMKNLNLPVSNPHALRHTFATQLMNNGAPLSAIQQLMGHSSLVATQPYLHVNIERLKQVHAFAHPKK